MSHPERVEKRLVGDEDAVTVAWLHDVLEDTDETKETLLEQGVPEYIVKAVELLTKSENQTYSEYLQSLADCPLAKKVKIQDMLDNLSDSPTEKQIIKYSKGFLTLFAVDVSPRS